MSESRKILKLERNEFPCLRLERQSARYERFIGIFAVSWEKWRNRKFSRADKYIQKHFNISRNRLKSFNIVLPSQKHIRRFPPRRRKSIARFRFNKIYSRIWNSNARKDFFCRSRSFRASAGATFLVANPRLDSSLDETRHDNYYWVLKPSWLIN